MADMSAHYRLTKRTIDDYGSAQHVSHQLSKIPDGSHWSALPLAITVGSWAANCDLGTEFTVTFAKSATHSAKTEKTTPP